MHLWHGSPVWLCTSAFSLRLQQVSAIMNTAPSQQCKILPQVAIVFALCHAGGWREFIVACWIIIYNFQVKNCFLKPCAKTEKLHEIRRRREVHFS